MKDHSSNNEENLVKKMIKRIFVNAITNQALSCESS